MNDELPLDDAQRAEEDDKRLPVTVFLLGAGFIGGLLCGLVMLASGSPTDDAPAAASKFSTPERQMNAAQLAAAGQTTTETRPAVEDNAETMAAERDRLQAELEALKLKQEVAELQLKLDRMNTSPVSTALRSSSEGESTHRVGTESTEPTSASIGETTLEFWNRMNDVIDREAAMRSTPQGGVSASNAADFLDARVQAAEYAVDALRKLKSTGVDNRAVEVAEALTAWYEQGREVAQTGRDLMTQPPGARQGAAGKRYQADEKTYSQAVNEVNALGERARQELSQAYGMRFPALK